MKGESLITIDQCIYWHAKTEKNYQNEMTKYIYIIYIYEILNIKNVKRKYYDSGGKRSFR